MKKIRERKKKQKNKPNVWKIKKRRRVNNIPDFKLKKRKKEKNWDGNRKNEVNGESKWASVLINNNRKIIAVEEEIQEESIISLSLSLCVRLDWWSVRTEK